MQRGGANPLEVIKDYKGKVELIHLKDYRIAEIPQDGFDALYSGDLAKFMDYFTNTIQFAELGTGSLPLKEIIEESISSGARYLLVEQDDTYGVDPFESLKISRESSIGIGLRKLVLMITDEEVRRLFSSDFFLSIFKHYGGHTSGK